MFGEGSVTQSIGIDTARPQAAVSHVQKSVIASDNGIKNGQDLGISTRTVTKASLVRCSLISFLCDSSMENNF